MDLLIRLFSKAFPLMCENPILICVSFGTVLFFALWDWIRRSNTAKAKSCEATRFDWEDEVSKMALPHASLPHGVNAARLTLFATAAYDGQCELRAAIKKRMESIGVLYDEWENENAAGILTYHPEHRTMIIAVAGTDDADDAKNDADVFSARIAEWGEATGIPVSDDVVEAGCRSTGGFLAYTALAFNGIRRCLAKHSIDASKAEITIVGHSLGGASSCLLQLTKTFEGSSCYTYGSARPYRAFSKQVERINHRVVNIFDPVASAPPQCAHPRNAKTIIIRGKGSVKTRIPVWYAPIVLAVSIMYWIIGIIGNVIQFVSGAKTVSVADGHSLTAYYTDLRPLA